MTRRFAPLALAIAVAVAPLAAQTAPTQAKPAPQTTKLTGVMAAVQGTWQMAQVNGQDAAAAGQDITITITDNKYVQTINGTVAEKGTFKIDETKKPMTIDISVVEGDDAGQTQLGIFEINGKTMTGKLSNPGGTARPTDFAVAEGFFVFTMVKK